MLKERFRIYRFITLLGDIALLNVSFFIIHYYFFEGAHTSYHLYYFKMAIAFTIGWIYLGYLFKLYNYNRIEPFEQSFARLFKTVVVHALLLALFNLILKDFSISKKLFSYSYLLFIPSISIWRIFMIYLLKNIRSSDSHYRTAIIIGSGTVAVQMFDVLKTYRGYGYKVLGLYDDSNHLNGHAVDYKIAGTIIDAKKYCKATGVQDIFCALPLTEIDTITDLMHYSEKNLIRMKIVPDFTALNNKPISIDYYGFLPVISPSNEPLNNFFNQFQKRTFDFLFSILVIVLLLSWIIPIIALIIKLSSKGPVFYRQTRSGINYKPFRIFKFRTMSVTESDEQFKQATKDDPRITPVGKFLRRYNIDELPQFINVLLGDMSVVGPRPHPVKLNEEYKSIIDKFMIRHLVLPGVTGLAQVRGLRGETADKLIMRKRVMTDLFYIENWSFLLDIKIILLTVWNMFKGEKNAH